MGKDVLPALQRQDAPGQLVTTQGLCPSQGSAPVQVP